MYKIAVIGIAASFLGIAIKKEKAEYAILIGIAAGSFIFGYAILQLSVIVNFMKELIEKLPIKSDYLGVILKMLGVTYVAEFASNICKDAGYQAIAGQIEMFAKLAIVALSVPGLQLFLHVLELYL